MVNMCAEACFGIPKKMLLGRTETEMIGDESLLEILKGY